MGPLGYPETLVRYYHNTLRSIPESLHLFPSPLADFGYAQAVSVYSSRRNDSYWILWRQVGSSDLWSRPTDAQWLYHAFVGLNINLSFPLTFWHRSFTFNSNKSPTWCNNFSVYYPDVCLQLNMFRAFFRPSSGAQWLQWQSCCVRGRAGYPARPRTQHGCHHDTKVKPEAATAVIELLMMGWKTPEICWAVNKHQDNKLKICCIRLVIYLN